MVDRSSPVSAYVIVLLLFFAQALKMAGLGCWDFTTKALPGTAHFPPAAPGDRGHGTWGLISPIASCARSLF